MARRGNSTSIILLLVCLILLVGGVAAGYVAIDKKIIENPFASLLQGEPMTLPSSEPISVPATSTEETDFFMKTDRPKAGTAPFLTAAESLKLTPGTTINCTRFVFPGDSTDTKYRYMGKTEVRKYPNASIAHSWGAHTSKPISCRGLIKGPDMEGNWPTGTPPVYSLRDAQTQPNGWGEGKSVYLDRHNVECGDDGLNQFKLGRPHQWLINYNYKCLEGINSSATINKNTDPDDWGGGDTVYLDRHNVDCGDKPIARFQLVRPSTHQIRYDYRCSNKQAGPPCRNANTGWDQESSQNVYLDRHDVRCNADEAITRFQLSRNGQGKFRYDYKCCKVVF